MKNADQYATAFYFAMRDTLVAKDLESATAIAYGAKRWRVVTLEGQLIDMSGTMAGGGTQVARGLMGSKIVDKDQEQQQVRNSLRTLLISSNDIFLARPTRSRETC